MEFKVGDRVAAYGVFGRKNGAVGIVSKDVDAGGSPNICVVFNSNTETGYSWVHPKQCRRFKKERRRVWLEVSDDASCYSNVREIWSKMKRGEKIEFVEVRRK